MDKEERKLGTPYLQDMEIVSWLTKYRSYLFLKLDAISANQWICNVYEYISSYRREIEHDAKRLYSLLDDDFFNKSNWKIEDYDVKKDDVVNKFPYIKELSPKFAADYKKGRQELIKLYHEIIDFRDYNSDEESYYKAIEELYKTISVHDMWIRKKNSDYFDQRRKQQNETKESESNNLSEEDIKVFPQDSWETLFKYFKPKEEFLEKSKDDKIKILKFIICTRAKKGCNGNIPKLLKALDDNFKPKKAFNYDEYSQKRPKASDKVTISKASIIAKILYDAKKRAIEAQIGKFDNLYTCY